jgi:hypothetical protein
MNGNSKHNQSGQTGGYGASVDMTTGNNGNVPIINQPSGFRLAQTFTVEFGISPPIGGAAVAFGVVQWVENGAQVRRVISIGSGATLSGCGTGAQVSVYDATTSPLSSLGKKYTISAILSPGVRGAQSHLPTLIVDLPQTLESFTAPGTGFLKYSVPQDSGVIAAEVTIVDTIGNPATPCQAYVQAVSQVGAVLKYWVPSLSPGMVALPPGTVALVVQNTSGTVVAQTSVTYGIDG